MMNLSPRGKIGLLYLGPNFEILNLDNHQNFNNKYRINKNFRSKAEPSTGWEKG